MKTKVQKFTEKAPSTSLKGGAPPTHDEEPTPQPSPKSPLERPSKSPLKGDLGEGRGLERLYSYFPTLTPTQREQFAALQPLYEDWNAKINVISRKDIDGLYLHHVLHSLAIARLITFRPATRILDLGTGGGFPGIPLAILFPQAHFRLIDSICKKVRVAQAVAQAIGLQNVECIHRNAIEEKDRFHFVVSRAVMPLPDLHRLVHKNIDNTHQFNALPNGIITLKGGDLHEELRPFGHRAVVTPIAQYFTEEWYQEKQIVFLPQVSL